MNTNTAQRNSNLDLLRVVAMFMVVTLHYLSRSGLLQPLSVVTEALGTAENTAGGIATGSGAGISSSLAWFLEALALPAVNVYVLISGYFVKEGRFKLRKLITLWCQVLFYSLGLSAVILIIQAIMEGSMGGILRFCNLFELQRLVFPLSNRYYWFATDFILLYILAPFLKRGIEALPRKQHGFLVLILLGVYCIVPTVIPYDLPMAAHGYSLEWFILLYLLGGYIRLYGIPFLEKKPLRAFAGYVLCAALTLSMGRLFSAYFAHYGQETDLLRSAYGYNSLFVLGAAVCLFYTFKDMKPLKGVAAGAVTAVAPYVFGVYLLHKNLMAEEIWVQVLKVKGSYGGARVGHYIGCCLLILLAGLAVDWVRAKFFVLAEKLILWGWKLYLSRKELFDYLIVGGLTTVVSWVAYLAFAYGAFRFIADDVQRGLISNAASWVLAVIFAYITNRTFVFHSTKTAPKEIAVEFTEFVGARLFSFFVEELMLFAFLQILHMNDVIAKLIISVVVIVLNYIFSKLWIFKKK